MDLHDAKVERGTKEQKTSKKNVLQVYYFWNIIFLKVIYQCEIKYITI